MPAARRACISETGPLLDHVLGVELVEHQQRACFFPVWQVAGHLDAFGLNHVEALGGEQAAQRGLINGRGIAQRHVGQGRGEG